MFFLRKNDVFRVEITGYNSEGFGIARVQGRVIFIRGAARGDIADVRILRVSSNAAWARIETLVRASAARITHGCPEYPQCGGCDFQHVTYEEELSAKLDRVESALRRIGNVEPHFDGLISAENIEHYRNKAVIPLGHRGGGIIAGFYRSNSHDIVEFEDCFIQNKVAVNAVFAVRAWMEDNGVSAYDEVSGTGLVRRVYVRSNYKSEALITVVASDENLPKTQKLINNILKVCPSTVGVLLNINKTRGNTVLSERYTPVWGADFIDDRICGLDIRLSAASFYQVNRDMAQRLYDRAADYAFGSATGGGLLDLYCGIGTLTLCLTKRADRAVGLEISARAVKDATSNAARNGVHNAEFIRADADSALSELKALDFTPDIVTVDPPRRGLSDAVIDAIFSLRPKRLVYISCDPATLARDLAILNSGGYRSSRYTIVDMFPRTANVECIVSLELSEK